MGIPPVLMPAILVSHWGNSFDTTGLMSSEFPYSDKGPCYRPHHDIVIPPPQQHDLAQSPLVGAAGCVPRLGPATCPPPERTTVLYFAGKREWDDTGKYSHGVRQKVFDLFSDEPGFKVQPTGTDDDLRRSVFCLAPAGLAFGDRLFQAIAYGCIPVVIQDNVTQVRSKRLLRKCSVCGGVGSHLHEISCGIWVGCGRCGYGNDGWCGASPTSSRVLVLRGAP
jgi:hypothetical protein